VPIVRLKLAPRAGDPKPETGPERIAVDCESTCSPQLTGARQFTTSSSDLRIRCHQSDTTSTHRRQPPPL